MPKDSFFGVLSAFFLASSIFHFLKKGNGRGISHEANDHQGNWLRLDFNFAMGFFSKICLLENRSDFIFCFWSLATDLHKKFHPVSANILSEVGTRCPSRYWCFNLWLSFCFGSWSDNSFNVE